MNIGRFEIEHLSEGQFELYQDGSLTRSDAHTVRRRVETDEDLYLPMYNDIGIDPILVRDSGHNILLDAGLGLGLDSRRRNTKISNIRTNLEIFGIDAAEVNHVIVTHLHHDHVAGLAHANADSAVVSTLPNATIWVQRKEWEFALQMVDLKYELSDAPYRLDDLYRLVSDGQIRFIDETTRTIIPGIEVIRTGGHTPGHQIVRIRDNNQSAYYFGDLIPNEHFLNFRMLRNADVDITESRQIKMLLMKQAFLESAEILFYHSVHLKHGKLARDPNRQYVLMER